MLLQTRPNKRKNLPKGRSIALNVEESDLPGDNLFGSSRTGLGPSGCCDSPIERVNQGMREKV